MVFTSIEWMALIFLVVVSIKILVILINPKIWMNSVVKKIWNAPILAGFICLILALVVLYYLLLGGISLLEIFAVMLFVGLLAGVGISIYSKEMVGFADKLMKKKFLKKSWLYILIWIILIIWGIYEIFI